MTTLNDNIVSLANSIGSRTAARDFVGNKRLTDNKLADLYANSWIIQKFVDGGVSDMTRLNRNIETTLDSEETKSLESTSRRLGVFKHRQDVLTWVSVYGDAMVVAITDAEDLESPLNLDEEKIVRFIVLDKTAYDFDRAYEDDIRDANFGRPRMYRINVGRGNVLIHNSRVCRIEAGRRSIKDKNGVNGKYGRSDIQSIYQPLINYLTTATNISDIVDQSKVDVLKIQDFNLAIAAGKEEQFALVAQAMRAIQSSTDALMIDKTTDYERKEMTFAGLVEILKAQRDDLAGACSRPLTRLFGQSASGFASGAEDNQIYYETIASLQEARLRPIDDFFDKFILHDMQSEYSQLDYTYPSIELTNEVEESTVLGTTVTALSTALQDGVITEVEYATELKNKGLVDSITDESIKVLKDFLNYGAQNQGSETEQASRSLLSQTAISAN
jgi:phage-related protein, HI1409 family